MHARRPFVWPRQGFVASVHGSGSVARVTAIVAGPASVRRSLDCWTSVSVSGKRNVSDEPFPPTAKSAPGVTGMHVAAATPGVMPHAATAAARLPQFAESATTVRGPDAGGVKRMVTTCSTAAALKPGEASQGRTDTSTVSPGAENGRFVVPSAPANVKLRCGITLHAACTAPGTPTHRRKATRKMRRRPGDLVLTAFSLWATRRPRLRAALEESRIRVDWLRPSPPDDAATPADERSDQWAFSFFLAI